MTKKYFILVLFLSIMPLSFLILTTDLVHTHDGLVHLSRLPAYYKALMDGQVLPRWAGDLNYGYGLPLFNFMYHLPYLIGSFLIALGASLVTSFKILLIVSFVASGLGMFAFVRELTKNDEKALLVTVFYQFAPFRFVELLVRGSLGELYTYATLPFVLFFLARFFRSRSFRDGVGISVATALLILSHNSVSLVFFLCVILFVFILAPSKQLRVYALLALLCGLSLTSFYWLPAIAEHRYTYGDLFMKDMFRTHFPPLANVLLPNFVNDPRLQTGGVSVQIGLLHEIALILAAVTVVMRKKLPGQTAKVLILALLIAAGAVFFIFPVSRPLWEHIPLLRQFQFPWRFLSLVVFASSLCGLSFFAYPFLRRKSVYALLLVLPIVSSAYFWRPPLGFDVVKDESVYWNYPLNTTYFGETDVIWSAGPAKGYPKNQIEVIDGTATISDVFKKSNLHTFSVYAETDARLVDHTQYFPGWRVYVDGKKTPIEFQDQNWRGLVTFYVPKGPHAIRAVFGNTPIRLGATIVSVCTALFLIIVSLRSRKIKTV